MGRRGSVGDENRLMLLVAAAAALVMAFSGSVHQAGRLVTETLSQPRKLMYCEYLLALSVAAKNCLVPETVSQLMRARRHVFAEGLLPPAGCLPAIQMQ